MNIAMRKTIDEEILDEMGDGCERSGSQIAAMMNIGSAKLYPALRRLEDAHRLTSKWEEGHFPRRRLYRLFPLYESEAEARADWHTIAPRFRTKERLAEMLAMVRQ